MKTFVIREPLAREWNNEFVYFDVSFAQGQQKDDRLTFVTAGDGGPQALATQITDINRHSDGSIASAKAWCRVDLKPEQAMELQLQPLVSPSLNDSPYWREGSECIEVGNAIMAAQVPLSGVYRPNSIPGPVMALRLGTGRWMGRGVIQATKEVLLRTVLVSQGPLFVRWQTTLAREGRVLAQFDCTLWTGEDIIRIDETTSFDSDLAYDLDLFPGLVPDRFLVWGGGWCGNSPNIRPLDYARAEELGTVDWNSGHHQMSLAWMGLYRDGAEPFVGVVELDSGAWTNLSFNRIGAFAKPPESLVLHFPLPGGRKVYALVCCRAALNTQHLNGRQYNHIAEIHARWAEVPLQKVKDWVLEWDDREPQRPFLQCDVDGVAKTRAKIKANSDMRRPYEAWASGLEDAKKPITVPEGLPAYEKAVAEAKARSLVPTIGASPLTVLWVALEKESYAREAVVELDKGLQRIVDRVWQKGVLMDVVIFDGRHMKLWLGAYDLLKGGGFIDEATDRRIKRHFAFLAYCFDDPEYFPQEANLRSENDPEGFYAGLGRRIGNAVCPPNFHTEYYTTYGIMGCCFRSHPRAEHWRKRACAMFDRQLEVHYYEGGCYCESPNYHSHAFSELNQLAISLRRAGERDFYQHPRFKQQFEHFIRIQTPPIVLSTDARQHFFLPWRCIDPTQERVAVMPGNGNTGVNCSDQALPLELAVAGQIYRDSDPALSRRCMTTWRRAGRPCSTFQDDLTFLLMVDPTLDGEETLNLGSDLRNGAFVTFRGKPETRDEVFVLVKNGTATHHMDPDDGGFTIWAYGSPIASDYGYHTTHMGRMAGTGSTSDHNCVQFDNKSCGYMGIEQTLPPEKFVSTDLADLLVSYLPNTNLQGSSHMDRIPIQRIEHRRYTLFVKPHYLLVFDSIIQCVYTHKWWLHAQANDIKIDGPRVRFAGKFGVDLMAEFITPSVPQIVTGELGVMKHIYAEQSMAKDWRVFVAPLKTGQDFAISSTAGGRVVHVGCSEYQDTLLLAHYPFSFQEGTMRFRGRAGVFRTYADGRKQVQLLDGEKLES